MIEVLSSPESRVYFSSVDSRFRPYKARYNKPVAKIEYADTVYNVLSYGIDATWRSINDTQASPRFSTAYQGRVNNIKFYYGNGVPEPITRQKYQQRWSVDYRFYFEAPYTETYNFYFGGEGNVAYFMRNSDGGTASPSIGSLDFDQNGYASETGVSMTAGEIYEMRVVYESESNKEAGLVMLWDTDSAYATPEKIVMSAGVTRPYTDSTKPSFQSIRNFSQVEFQKDEDDVSTLSFRVPFISSVGNYSYNGFHYDKNSDSYIDRNSFDYTLPTLDSTIGHWKFLNSSADSSSYNNNLTFVNMPHDPWMLGYTLPETPTAIDFVGTRYAQIETSRDSDFEMGTNDFSVEFIFKAANGSMLLRKSGTSFSAAGGGYFFGISGNVVRIGLEDDAGHSEQWADASGALSSDRWYYVAVTVDRNNDQMKVYINGEKLPPTKNISSLTGNLNYTADALKIGAHSFSNIIDEVAVHKGKVLTASEIASRYRGVPKVIIKKNRMIRYHSGYQNSNGQDELVKKFTGQIRDINVRYTNAADYLEVKCKDFSIFTKDSINLFSPNPIDYWQAGYYENIKGRVNGNTKPRAFDGWEVSKAYQVLLADSYIDPYTFYKRKKYRDFYSNATAGGFYIDPISSTPRQYLPTNIKYGLDPIGAVEASGFDEEYAYSASTGEYFQDVINNIFKQWYFRWGFNEDGYPYLKRVNVPSNFVAATSWSYDSNWDSALNVRAFKGKYIYADDIAYASCDVTGKKFALMVGTGPLSGTSNATTNNTFNIVLRHGDTALVDTNYNAYYSTAHFYGDGPNANTVTNNSYLEFANGIPYDTYRLVVKNISNTTHLNFGYFNLFQNDSAYSASPISVLDYGEALCSTVIASSVLPLDSQATTGRLSYTVELAGADNSDSFTGAVEVWSTSTPTRYFDATSWALVGTKNLTFDPSNWPDFEPYSDQIALSHNNFDGARAIALRLSVQQISATDNNVQLYYIKPNYIQYNTTNDSESYRTIIEGVLSYDEDYNVPQHYYSTDTAEASVVELSFENSVQDQRTDAVVLGRRTGTQFFVNSDGEPISINPNNEVYTYIQSGARDLDAVFKSTASNYVGRPRPTVVIDPSIINQKQADFIAYNIVSEYGSPRKKVSLGVQGNPTIEVGDCVAISENYKKGISTRDYAWVTSIKEEYNANRYITTIDTTPIKPVNSYWQQPDINPSDFGNNYIYNLKIKYNGFWSQISRSCYSTDTQVFITKPGSVANSYYQEMIPASGYCLVGEEMIKYDSADITGLSNEIRLTSLTRNVGEYQSNLNHIYASNQANPHVVIGHNPYSLTQARPYVNFDLLVDALVDVSVYNYRHPQGFGEPISRYKVDALTDIEGDTRFDSFESFKKGNYNFVWGGLDRNGDYNSDHLEEYESAVEADLYAREHYSVRERHNLEPNDTKTVPEKFGAFEFQITVIPDNDPDNIQVYRSTVSTTASFLSSYGGQFSSIYQILASPGCVDLIFDTSDMFCAIPNNYKVAGDGYGYSYFEREDRETGPWLATPYSNLRHATNYPITRPVDPNTHIAYGADSALPVFILNRSNATGGQLNPVGAKGLKFKFVDKTTVPNSDVKRIYLPSVRYAIVQMGFFQTRTDGVYVFQPQITEGNLGDAGISYVETNKPYYINIKRVLADANLNFIPPGWLEEFVQEYPDANTHPGAPLAVSNYIVFDDNLVDLSGRKAKQARSIIFPDGYNDDSPDIILSTAIFGHASDLNRLDNPNEIIYDLANDSNPLYTSFKQKIWYWGHGETKVIHSTATNRGMYQFSEPQDPIYYTYRYWTYDYDDAGRYYSRHDEDLLLHRDLRGEYKPGYGVGDAFDPAESLNPYSDTCRFYRNNHITWIDENITPMLLHWRPGYNFGKSPFFKVMQDTFSANVFIPNVWAYFRRIDFGDAP